MMVFEMLYTTQKNLKCEIVVIHCIISTGITFSFNDLIKKEFFFLISKTLKHFITLTRNVSFNIIQGDAKINYITLTKNIGNENHIFIYF